MAPVAARLVSGTKYVAVKIPRDSSQDMGKDHTEKEFRPTFAKLPSCDFSVEQSEPDWYCEKKWQDALCGFSSKKQSTECYQNKVCMDQETPQKPAASKTLELEESEWKLGALERKKSPSPTENDDQSVVVLAAAIDKPCSSSKNEEVAQDIDIIADEIRVESQTLKKTQKKKKPGTLKRQSIGKKKRNTYIILCPEPKTPEPRQRKVKRASHTKRDGTAKIRQTTRNVLQINSSAIREDGINIPKTRKRCSRSMPCVYKCGDSGVSSSGSTYSNSSGSTSGGDSGSSEYGGNNSGYGDNNSGYGDAGKNGMGGSGGDDGDDKRPLRSDDVDMMEDDDKEEEEKDGDDVNMKSIQCDDDVVKSENYNELFSKLQTTNLQHSSYCSNQDCPRPLCPEMKREIDHFMAEQCTIKQDCLRCFKTSILMKMHAKLCKRAGCRVPQCTVLRKKKEVMQQPLPDDMFKPQTTQSHWNNADGKVAYASEPGFGRIFQDGIDYQKGAAPIGKGANGDVYMVHVPPASPLSNTPMVVKETKYIIPTEEVDVYKCMGDHKNIVKHYCVAMKGNDGKASIFMEACDKSLKDICPEIQDTNEVMFYWTQVLEAVAHLHENKIIHKDIKAKNVLVSQEPGRGEYFRAKLADFDSAKKLQAEFTKSGLKAMGTDGFVAPEVLARLSHGRPVDIYSLGCLLLELLGYQPKKELLKGQVQELCAIDRNIGYLVAACVKDDSEARPTACQILTSPFIQGFLRIPDQL